MPPDAAGLEALAAQIRRDLERIDHPAMPWLEPHPAPDGGQALDVLIAGAGQCGVAIAFGLKRAKVDNILVVDRAPYGSEGPWRTYARMHTLRSPKEYTGPDLDVPSLTYRSWHEARFGPPSWDALDLIPRELWAEYLLFVRTVTDIPVRNETAIVDVAPVEMASGDRLLRITLQTVDGSPRTVHARKLVFATGQDGMGRWAMPDFLAALPPAFRAHAADAIDFDRLAGKVVAVLGAGASAFDNAAVALEHGAAAVHLFCRRAEVQVIQPYRMISFAGFMRHLGDLDDEWRWRFMSRVLGLREGFSQGTWDRCAAFANFRFHSGRSWQGAALAEGAVEIATDAGPFRADFVIAGTGIEMDFAARPELGRFAHNIARWSDRYHPPAPERNDRLARFPYLAPDYSFVEKMPGETPWISDIHLFSIASTMSFGPSGSSINAMTIAVPKLVSGLTRGLFRGDVERHWTRLDTYDVPQVVLRPVVRDLRDPTGNSSVEKAS